MLTSMSSLRDAQTLKLFWESMGARFGLRDDGALDLIYTGSLLHDPAAKRDVMVFISDYCRELHALVVTNGDEMAISRFEFVARERLRGRFHDDRRSRCTRSTSS